MTWEARRKVPGRKRSNQAERRFQRCFRQLCLLRTDHIANTLALEPALAGLGAVRRMVVMVLAYRLRGRIVALIATGSLMPTASQRCVRSERDRQQIGKTIAHLARPQRILALIGRTVKVTSVQVLPIRTNAPAASSTTSAIGACSRTYCCWARCHAGNDHQPLTRRRGLARQRH
jgi:hypothetical protein